ncbi:MAG: S24/S26 family peptidase [Deltaproteobacteria bacterium]|nr:S24/S26 family peptidase [Deltaproteobacteria bacterium]
MSASSGPVDRHADKPFFVLERGDEDLGGLLQESLKAGGGRVSYVCQGHSMEPTLLPGDRVCLQRLTGDLKVGWIIAFPFNSGIILHRLVRLDKEMFWARGDSCAGREGPLPIGEVFARAIGYHRDGQWHSLESEKERILGLALNHVVGGIKSTAIRWPGLRKLTHLPVVRTVFMQLGQWFLGDLEIRPEKSVERVVGFLLAESQPLSQKLVSTVESRIESGELNMILARSKKSGLTGAALIWRLNSKVEGPLTDYLVEYSMPGFRILGGGNKLLSYVEKMTKKDGRRRIVRFVRPQDVDFSASSLEGYRRTEDVEYESLPSELRAGLAGHELCFEKFV